MTQQRNSYRCEAASLEGFVQQLAANYLPHGYWFYVTGHVPAGKDAHLLDKKLMLKYGVTPSRNRRARRKQSGLANVHYLRIGSTWVLVATKGEHAFFAEERGNIRDARRTPIQIGGYSISVKQGGWLRKKEESAIPKRDAKLRVRVQIARKRYQDMRVEFLERALTRGEKDLAQDFFNVPFEPYAPIRKQLLRLLGLVNSRRGEAGRSKLPTTVLRYRRRIVKPFGLEEWDAAA